MVGLSTPGGTRYCTGGTVVNPPDHKNVITILWSFPTHCVILHIQEKDRYPLGIDSDSDSDSDSDRKRSGK
jgi:hypothetical protein